MDKFQRNVRSKRVVFVCGMQRQLNVRNRSVMLGWQLIDKLSDNIRAEEGVIIHSLRG